MEEYLLLIMLVMCNLYIALYMANKMIDNLDIIHIEKIIGELNNVTLLEL